MTCARERRLEREAHEIGRRECLESAAHFGLTMSCADEYECGVPGDCDFFKRALESVTAFDKALP